MTGVVVVGAVVTGVVVVGAVVTGVVVVGAVVTGVVVVGAVVAGVVVVGAVVTGDVVVSAGVVVVVSTAVVVVAIVVVVDSTVHKQQWCKYVCSLLVSCYTEQPVFCDAQLADNYTEWVKFKVPHCMTINLASINRFYNCCVIAVANKCCIRLLLT